MKQTINKYQFRDAFMSIRPDNFSYESLEILFEYFEQLEDDIGEDIELDVIAICCDWVESTPDEIREYYDPVDVDSNSDIEDYLEEQTQLAGVTSTGNFVYMSF